jgi:integrase
LLEAARGDRMYAFYALATTTGMRNGEILRLQWEDIDLDAGTLQVRRTVFNGQVNAPKTAAGRRTIKLSKLAIRALEQYRGKMAKQRMSESPGPCLRLFGQVSLEKPVRKVIRATLQP